MVEHDRENCPRCSPYETDREFGNLVVSPTLFGANQLAKRGDLPGVIEVLRSLEKRLLAHMKEK